MAAKKESPRTNTGNNNPTSMKTTESNQEATRLRVKYETPSALYAGQVLVNATSGEVFLNFSSGIIPDQAGGESLLPIHTRIAMTRETATRLSALLDQTLGNKK